MSGATVIIGAGIIGCATAYYLATSGDTDPASIHLVEIAPELFASASGKAAGFLASDWFGPATADLGALSFRLHKQLADQHNGQQRWGYSRSTGTSLARTSKPTSEPEPNAVENGGSRANMAAVHDFTGPSNGPAWLRVKQGETLDTISADDAAGQVDPLRLSQFLLQESVQKGVQLHQPAEITRLMPGAAGTVHAVLRNLKDGTESSFDCRRILIAAGAWSGKVFSQLFPTASTDIYVGHLAGHSLVVKSPRWTSKHESSGCHAVFSTIESGYSPEIFSRIGGEIYIAGLNDPSLPLPRVATDAEIDPTSISRLRNLAERLLGQDGTDVSDLEVVREGLCFRPITRTGNPLVSRIPDGKLGPGVMLPDGVYIATGHGPWGISHSLGTGKVMAELLVGKSTSADLRRLAVR